MGRREGGKKEKWRERRGERSPVPISYFTVSLACVASIPVWAEQNEATQKSFLHLGCKKNVASHGPNCSHLIFAWPECKKLLCMARFRSTRTGTLATQASLSHFLLSLQTLPAGASSQATTIGQFLFILLGWKATWKQSIYCSRTWYNDPG